MYHYYLMREHLNVQPSIITTLVIHWPSQMAFFCIRSMSNIWTGYVYMYIYISIQHVYPNISRLPTNKINPKFQDFEAQYWCACVYFGAFVKFVKNEVSIQWNFVSCLREWMCWTDLTGSWKKPACQKHIRTCEISRVKAPIFPLKKTVFLRSTVPGGTNLADLRLTCHRGAHLPCSLRGRILTTVQLWKPCGWK